MIISAETPVTMYLRFDFDSQWRYSHANENTAMYSTRGLIYETHHATAETQQSESDISKRVSAGWFRNFVDEKVEIE